LGREVAYINVFDVTAIPLSSDVLDAVGAHLRCPECVVVDGENNIYVPDWRGGVTRIAGDAFAPRIAAD
jgi:hypothetical protein